MPRATTGCPDARALASTAHTLGGAALSEAWTRTEPCPDRRAGPLLLTPPPGGVPPPGPTPARTISARFATGRRGAAG